MDYSKYGISESYLPTIYHNKIVIDKTTAATANKNLTESAYVQGATGFLGNVSSSPIQTLVTVNMNIVFNVPNYADFVNLTKDDNFASSFKVITHLCWRDPNKNVNDNPTFEQLPFKYASQLQDMVSKINSVDYQVNTLTTVFNNISKDILNLSNFDNFTRYQRQFPDGQTYFQVPYTIKFQVPLENIPYMYLLSFVSVDDFDIDLNLNFGGFEIDDDSITAVSAIEAYNLSDGEGYNTGPLIIDTLINNNKTQTKGIFYTIAQNQSTYQGQIPPNVDLQEVTDADILREEKFNDLKGTPWLGGVHKHEGRYMAGASHTAESHPYLDANVVQNKKLIDLRPIKEVKELNINFTSALSNIKKTKTNYFADNSKLNFIEKLTIISDPLLSVNKDSDIDGFFVINYTDFLRKHSIFSNLLDNPMVLSQINVAAAVQDSLKIKILRHEVKSKISKLVFDSSRVDDNNIFYEGPGLQTQQFGGNINDVELPLGHLNVLNMAKDDLNINSQYSILEFYNFTDLDKKKAPETEYKYEIQVEMKDPLFEYLADGITLMDEAIRGNGKTLGLQQILDLISVKRGNKNIKSTGSEFSYVVDELNQQSINMMENFTIVDEIRAYDSANGEQSITDGDNPRLTVLDSLYDSKILLSLGSLTTSLNSAFVTIVNNILDLENAGAISIDLFRLVINVLSSIRDNLKNSINAISNVDITTQAFGYRAATLSPQNGNLSKRIIKESKLSSTKITKQNYGFDYLEVMSLGKNKGLKQVPVNSLKNIVDNGFLPQYFDTEQANQYSVALKTYLDNYAYSTLPLARFGVKLPDNVSLPREDMSWPTILQILLLFIEKNASRLTTKNIFTYTENNASDFKFDVNKNIMGLDIVNDENVELFKSLDRGQKQLSKKGLSVQDEIKTNQSIFVEYTDEIQTDQKSSQSVITIDNLKRNNISDYFLNYVNNAIENGNQNKNKDLDGIDILALSPAANENISDVVKDQTIAVISLIEYYILDSDILGQPLPGTSYREYYENKVWSPETKKIFFDKFADFFFDFINVVKIEYLTGFDSYDYDLSEEIDFQSSYAQGITETLEESQQSKIDQFNNIDISSNNWSQLTNQALSNLNDNQVILCKMVDFTPAAFESVNIPLIQKLKFYKKYYNYFLIIKGQRDLQIRAFGSTI